LSLRGEKTLIHYREKRVHRKKGNFSDMRKEVPLDERYFSSRILTPSREKGLKTVVAWKEEKQSNFGLAPKGAK